VYSGHTHFTHFPEPYKCPQSDNTIKQIILTSINAQLDWTSKSGIHYPQGYKGAGEPEFLVATVSSDGATKMEKIKL